MQITPAIHALRHPFGIPVAPGIVLDRFVYSFILFGETITLIDTGVAGSEKTIFEAIGSLGRDPAEISLIVLTHSHPDHIGAARAIREETGCSIVAHRAERAWIEDTDLQARERPVPGFAGLVGGPVPLDHEITDGEVIDPDGSGTIELQMMHVPGHSPGSIALFLRDQGALFSGDAIPVPGDLPVYDDALDSLRSVRRLSKLPGIRFLLSSWDDPREGADAIRRLETAPGYLQRIHGAVIASAGEGSPDPLELARRTAAVLNLPPQAVSPLLARTFAANLRVRDRQDLLAGT